MGTPGGLSKNSLRKYLRSARNFGDTKLIFILVRVNENYISIENLFPKIK
jgi:hypothetical protein